MFVLSTILTFALGALSGANPAAAVLGETATPADIARMKHEFGLDVPLWQQYLTWLGNALHGDLGRSWFTTVPVSDSIRTALPVDLSIAGLALVMAVLIGGAAGIAAALSNGGVVDRAVTLVCSAVATVPPFVIGIMLIVVFSVKLGALPSGGYVPLEQDPVEWLRFAILPAVALSIDAAGSLARQLRTSLVGALRENYVTGAEMRGFSRRRVLFGHVLRNASGPALAVLGMAVPTIIGGAVITEKLFNLPGIAQLALRRRGAGRRPGHPRHPAGHRRGRADREHGRQRRADRPQPGRPSRRPAGRRAMSTLRRIWTVPSARISIIILLGVAVLVVAGSALAPHDPLDQDPTRMLQGPGGAHWLGTDYLGRDVLSRLMAGTRISVAGALEAVVVAAAAGHPARARVGLVGPARSSGSRCASPTP